VAAAMIPALCSSARRACCSFGRAAGVLSRPVGLRVPYNLSTAPDPEAPYSLETRYEALATSFFSLLVSATFVAELIRSINRMPFR